MDGCLRDARHRLYRIADNFLAFWLGVLARHRSQIDLGLGRTILPVLLRELDDYLGPRWEEAFRLHLRRLADERDLGEDILAIGPFWTAAEGAQGQNEIDAVVLAARDRAASLVGEAKWARRVDGRRSRWELEQKARAAPGAPRSALRRGRAGGGGRRRRDPVSNSRRYFCVGVPHAPLALGHHRA